LLPACGGDPSNDASRAGDADANAGSGGTDASTGAAGSGGAPGAAGVPESGGGAGASGGSAADAGADVVAGDDAGGEETGTDGGGRGDDAADAGGDGESFVDEASDVPMPALDLLSGAIYRDGDFVEIRLRFAGTPLTDGGGVSVDAGLWTLSARRDGAGLSLRLQAGGLSIGFDPCTHVWIDDATNRLVLRVPSAVFSSTPTSLSVGTTGGDDVSSFPWQPLAYPGALSSASPACEPWDSARTSTLAFRDISLGNGFGCGITVAHEAVCWGEPAALTTLGSPPSGPFDQVSVSVHSWYESEVYACGLMSTGEIACWGGSPPVIAGAYRWMGDPFGCAVRDDGDLSCIDMGTGGSEIRSAIGPISTVVGAGLEECHLTEAGTIVCLTQNMAPAGNAFIDLAFGSESRACGLRGDGTLDCDLASAIPYVLASIDAGSRPWGSFAVGCGLTDAGSPICWGAAGVVAPVHPGPFVRLEVSSTNEGICGFRADQTLVCWDYSHVAGNPVPATSPP
jgi:hypothetical protein